MSEYDREASIIGKPLLTGGLLRHGKKKIELLQESKFFFYVHFEVLRNLMMYEIKYIIFKMSADVGQCKIT